MRSMLLCSMMLALGLASLAEARTEDDCRRAWSRGVRSYLTKNRRAGPDGKVPKNLDEEELMAQAWDAAFSPACKLEAEGKKPEARVEAAMIGVQILSKLDPTGCVRFMDKYMQSNRAQDICSSAQRSGTAQIREQITSSIPKR